MSKKIWICATVFASLIATLVVAPVNAGSNSAQIIFAIKGDTIKYLVVEGTNQDGKSAKWQWTMPNNWSTGAYVLTTNGWWWKGDVKLYFAGVNTGKKFCHIENLKMPTSGNTTVVMYIPEIGTCTGEAGNSGTPVWVKMTLQYYLGNSKPKFYEAASTAYNAFECRYAIAETLAKGEKVISVKTFWACRGVATDTLTWLFKKIGVEVK